MKDKNLLERIYKRTWTRKISMTDRSLGLVILVAAVAGATATVLAKRIIKGIISKTSTTKSGETSNSRPPEFHETARSAEISGSSWPHE